MSLLSIAAGYIIKGLSQNKKAEEFKEGIFGGFIDWITPIFLKDDPGTEQVMKMEGNENVKKTVAETKLKELAKDSDFIKALTTWVEKLEGSKVKEKGIITNAKVKAKNSIKIGDKSIGGDEHWDRKNIVEGGEFETDGDFHLGDG